MATRRILQGGEDIYPGDNGATRYQSFHVGTSVGSGGSFRSDGSSGARYGTVWVPPSRALVLETAVITMGGAVSNSPTNPGNAAATLCISDSGNYDIYNIITCNIPHGDWASKGGGSGFSYPASPTQLNGTMNGGNKGSNSDSGFTSAYCFGGPLFFSVPLFLVFPVLGLPGSTGTQFTLNMTLTGGDGGGKGTNGLTFYVHLMGYYLS